MEKITVYVYHVIRVDEHRGEDGTVLVLEHTHIAGPFGWFGDALERKENEMKGGFGTIFEIAEQKLELTIT